MDLRSWLVHRQVPSPNWNARKLPPGAGPSMVVLHYTGMRTAADALERMCNPAAEVSAHYMIDEDGTVTQLVDEQHRAWHAGRSSWRGETDVKVRIEEYSMRTDSGGPGRHRGGTGVVYSIRVLRDGTEILGRGLERFVFQPWGIEGGAPGQAARVVLNLGTPEERDLGKIAVVRAKEGDLLTVMTPGGGGYGDPFTRPVADVLRDVQLGFVSRAAATSDYGVVFKAGADAVDEAATAALRAGRAETTGFGFGQARLAWETVFDDASMTRLAITLLSVPSAVRNSVRTALFETVIPGVTGQGPAALLVAGFDAAAARARLAAAIHQLDGRWLRQAA